MRKNVLLAVAIVTLFGSGYFLWHSASSFFFNTKDTVTLNTSVTNTDNTSTVADTFEKLAQMTERINNSLSQTLIKSRDFQRAATYASKLEEREPDISNIPLEDAIKSALVNIFCTYKTDTYTRTTTGTGFFISNKGIILTNAHVAQFLLLEEAKTTIKDAECTIRTGSPAVATYKAELMYISPMWVFHNTSVITSDAPRGTGERDYALLYVTKSLDAKPLPAQFPAIPVDTQLLSRDVQNTVVLAAGYPAEDFFKGGANGKLNSRLSSTKIRSLYTFGSNYADIFAIGDSAVGEQGASGGPVVKEDSKKTIGLIVTKGDERTEGTHSLRALTLSYIDRTIKEETGFVLRDNLKGDPSLRGDVFKKAMTPALVELLTEELQKQTR